MNDDKISDSNNISTSVLITTTKHVYKVTVTTTEKCEGTNVKFASVLFNLQHKQKRSEIYEMKYFFIWVQRFVYIYIIIYLLFILLLVYKLTFQ